MRVQARRPCVLAAAVAVLPNVIGRAMQDFNSAYRTHWDAYSATSTRQIRSGVALKTSSVTCCLGGLRRRRGQARRCHLDLAEQAPSTPFEQALQSWAAIEVVVSAKPGHQARPAGQARGGVDPAGAFAGDFGDGISPVGRPQLPERLMACLP